MDRQISLAIPYYNNSQYIMDALRVAITDNRVSEIIICDDDSKDISKLTQLLIQINSNKIKMYKNSKNLGCYLNKIESISKCTNEWAILLDSDNVIESDYIDTLYNIPEWKNDTIYHPCWAKTFPREPSPNLDYRIWSNTQITHSFYLNNFNNNKFQCLINNCNYFVPVKAFTNCMNAHKNNYVREQIDALDSAVLFTEWLTSGNTIYVVDNLIYGHRLHNQSNYNVSTSHRYSNQVLQFLYNKIGNAYLQNCKKI
jgi:glycosyltransferase involved in cell wall biosynthesis